MRSTEAHVWAELGDYYLGEGPQVVEVEGSPELVWVNIQTDAEATTGVVHRHPLAGGLDRKFDAPGRPGFLRGIDPMRCSAYVANLGSVGLGAAYHHLFEWGTCSLFVTIGQIKPTVVVGADGNPAVRRTMELKIALDERIAMIAESSPPDTSVRIEVRALVMSLTVASTTARKRASFAGRPRRAASDGDQMIRVAPPVRCRTPGVTVRQDDSMSALERRTGSRSTCATVVQQIGG